MLYFDVGLLLDGNNALLNCIGFLGDVGRDLFRGVYNSLCASFLLKRNPEDFPVSPLLMLLTFLFVLPRANRGDPNLNTHKNEEDSFQFN